MLKYYVKNYGDLNLTKEDILSLWEQEGEILKADNRSYLKCINAHGKKLIIKQPLEKNRRKWVRFTTLFRDSEVNQILKVMKKLSEIGVITNEAIASLEIRKFGMVVNSYAIYGYLAGERIQAEDAKAVVNLMKKIHKAGYLHGDTQFRNFLRDGDKIVTIDSNLPFKSLGKISENLEYQKLIRNIPEAEEFIDTESLAYKLAKFMFISATKKRKIKKIIRTKLGKKR